MQDIQIWKEKMKEKRKQTPFREYLKHVVSQRTLAFYKNNEYTSIYPQTPRIKGIISHTEYQDKRDMVTSHGREYDTSKSFFENIQTLFSSVEMPPTILFGTCENANFTDQTLNCKNSYLSYVVIKDCENVMYSLSIKEKSINVLNSVMVRENSENIYFSKGVIKGFNIFYSKYIHNSSDIRFSTNLVGCHDCVFCTDLENKSYCIENIQYTKAEYLSKKKEILQAKQEFMGRYAKLSNAGNNIASTEVEGIYNIQCSNIQQGYMNYQIKNGRNIMLIGGKEPGENVYDCFLNTPSETDIYGVFSTGFCDNIYLSGQIAGGSNIFYSYLLENCSYCLGCIGLKNKQFCILNKEYNKDERYELANKIFEKMEAEGILGAFFPGSMNPFYFNDTAAYLIDDTFTQEEVTAEGYLRRDEEIKVDIPANAEVITTKDLNQFQGFDPAGPGAGNGERKINPEILKKVIKDEKGNYYRIVPMELQFLQKHGLPLPELHWLERIKLGFKFK